MVLRALRQAVHSLDLAGRPVLVAASGGVDSTVLLHGLHELSQPLRLKLLVGHVNHGLRGAGSDADERAVEAAARQLGLPFRSRRVEPLRLREGVPSRGRPTLQESARRLRYRALGAMARELGAERIATAHNADDQAETVLLRLLRGTGPAGLGGIPERSHDGRVVRPLLTVPREAIEAFARARRLTWREDPSNRSARFARAKLRERWLPGLAAEFNPQLLRALVDLAEAQRRESEWIEALVEREAASRFGWAEGQLWIEAKEWGALPEALARRLARRALHEIGCGRDVSRVHLDRMVRFLGQARPGTRIELPGRFELCCLGSRFGLGRAGWQPRARC